MDDEVLREVATTEIAADQWVMKLNGSSTTNPRGAGVVLYHRDGKTIALLFKL